MCAGKTYKEVWNVAIEPISSVMTIQAQGSVVQKPQAPAEAEKPESSLSPEETAEIEALLEKRAAARKAKDWAAADAIRDELAARHVVMKDTPNGVEWHVEK